MLFKWNKEDKSKGVIQVESGYYGKRKTIGTLVRSKHQIHGQINFDDGTITSMSLKKAKDLKRYLSKHYDNYQNQMVTVINIVSKKKVQIPRRHRGGVCDPSTESYHTF